MISFWKLEGQGIKYSQCIAYHTSDLGQCRGRVEEGRAGAAWVPFPGITLHQCLSLESHYTSAFPWDNFTLVPFPGITLHQCLSLGSHYTSAFPCDHITPVTFPGITFHKLDRGTLLVADSP